MTINEYQKLAMTTLNKELDEKEILMNAVMGLCGESGETIDIVKKHFFHGHELDRKHLIEEMGDVAWYLAELATALEVDLEDVLSINIDKLKARYPEGFETSRSINREQTADDIHKSEDSQSYYGANLTPEVIIDDLIVESDDDSETYYDALDEEFRRQVGASE